MIIVFFLYDFLVGRNNILGTSCQLINPAHPDTWSPVSAEANQTMDRVYMSKKKCICSVTTESKVFNCSCNGVILSLEIIDDFLEVGAFVKDVCV